MERYEPVAEGQSVLGGGSFGRVDKVQRKRDLKNFACKTIIFDGASKRRELAKREVEILSRLDHPNIVHYEGAQWEPQQVRLYMEYCQEGSLAQLIEQQRDRIGEPLEESYAWSIIYQLSNALAYCHHGSLPLYQGGDMGIEWKSPILHRDIKPGNVLLSSASETALDTIKLGDFGVGVVLKPGQERETYTAGTRRFMPPEITRLNTKWNTKCDIFSLGCTLFELCALVPAFDEHMESDEVATFESEDFSEGIKALIQSCMSADPNERPNALEIREKARSWIHEHPEFKSAFIDYQLLQAAENGNFEAVFDLLNRGADVKARASTDGEGVLHRAARSGNMALLPLLLEHGARVAELSYARETPLHCAAACGNGSVAQYLLDNGASISSTDGKGWTPVHTAAASNNNQLISTLVEEDVIRNVEVLTIDQHGYTPLHLAARNGCADALGFLLDQSAKIEAETRTGSTALLLAADGGHIEIIEALLRKGARIDGSGSIQKRHTALHIASSAGHMSAADFLLKNGARIEARNKTGRTPLHCAAAAGHESVVELLVTRGANIESGVNGGKNAGWTALHLASEKGHSPAIRALLRLQAKVNARTKDEETALHWAVARGYEAVVGDLLGNGADSSVRGPNRSMPLHWASTFGRWRMAEKLLDTGADIEARAGTKETPLLLAAMYGRTEMVQKLIDQGANTGAANQDGQTALHLAAKAGHERIVHWLIKKGANVKAIDSYRKTPLQVVQSTKASNDSTEMIIRILQGK